MQEQAQPTSLFWRIVRFPATRIVLGFFCILVLSGLTQSLFGLLPGQEAVLVPIVSAMGTALVACGTYYAFVRIVERRPVTELGSSKAAGELAAGILVGALLFTITIGIVWLLGYYQVSGINGWTIMVPAFAAAVIAGVVEELLFRGIFFRIIEESLGTWLALAISALFFGLSHLANPNATLPAAIAIALEAGVLLSAAYVLTRRLWLAIGIHFAWNFVQGGVFGVAISGFQGQGLLQGTLEGPALLSGGEFGAEASIFAVIVCLTAGLTFTWLAIKKGNFIKPFWVRR